MAIQNEDFLLVNRAAAPFKTKFSTFVSDIVHVGADEPDAERVSSGSLWLDTTNPTDPRLQIYDGTQWVETKAQIPEVPIVIISEDPPTEKKQGDLWWDSVNGTLYLYYIEDDYNDGAGPGTAQWVEAAPGAGGGGGASIEIGQTPPSPAKEGDLWFNQDTGTLYIYYVDPSDDEYWIEVAAPGGGGSGGANVTVSESAPATDDSTAGDLWYCTDDGRLYIYYDDGDSQQWVDASPPSVGGDGDGGGGGDYVLPTATAIRLGGIKVGNNLSVEADGTLNATTQDGTVGTLQEVTDAGNTTDNTITLGSTVDGANPGAGVTLYPAGSVYASVSDDDTAIWYGLKGGTGNPTSLITGNGNATFAGDVRNSDQNVGNDSGVGFRCGSTGYFTAQRPSTASDTDVVFNAYKGTAENIRFEASGSVEFAGSADFGSDVTVGNNSVTDNSLINIINDSGATVVGTRKTSYKNTAVGDAYLFSHSDNVCLLADTTTGEIRLAAGGDTEGVRIQKNSVTTFNDTITLDGSDGSATFAGGKFDVASEGRLKIQRTDDDAAQSISIKAIDGSSAVELYGSGRATFGGTTSSPNIDLIGSDGSASFAGDVVSGTEPVAGTDANGSKIGSDGTVRGSRATGGTLGNVFSGYGAGVLTTSIRGDGSADFASSVSVTNFCKAERAEGAAYLGGGTFDGLSILENGNPQATIALKWDGSATFAGTGNFANTLSSGPADFSGPYSYMSSNGVGVMADLNTPMAFIDSVDGSADFAGEVTAGEFSDTDSVGSLLSATGAVMARAQAGNQVIWNGLNGTTPTSQILGDGSAEFATGTFTINGAGGATSRGFAVQQNDGTTTAQIFLDGKADFKNQLRVVPDDGDAVVHVLARGSNELDAKLFFLTKNAGGGTTGSLIYHDGGDTRLYFNGNTTAGTKHMALDTDGNFEIGGLLPASPNIKLNADGSATLASGEVEVTTAGRLGLGTDSPKGLLHLEGDSIAETWFTSTGDGGSEWRIGAGDTVSGLNGGFRIYNEPNSISAISALPAGNVGIGRAPIPASSQPLVVEAPADPNTYVSLRSNSDTGIAGLSFGSPSNPTYASARYLFSDDSYGILVAGSGTESFRISSDGKIFSQYGTGVGGTAAAPLITLNSNGNATFANTSDEERVDITSRRIYFGSNSNNGIHTYSMGSLRIDASTGDDSSSVIEMDAPDVSTNDFSIRLFRNTNTTGTSQLQIMAGDGTATETIKLHSDGRVIAKRAFSNQGWTEITDGTWNAQDSNCFVVKTGTSTLNMPTTPFESCSGLLYFEVAVSAFSGNFRFPGGNVPSYEANSVVPYTMKKNTSGNHCCYMGKPTEVA